MKSVVSTLQHTTCTLRSVGRQVSRCTCMPLPGYSCRHATCDVLGDDNLQFDGLRADLPIQFLDPLVLVNTISARENVWQAWMVAYSFLKYSNYWTHPWLSTTIAPQSVSTLQKTCDSMFGASIMSLSSLAADFFTKESKFLRTSISQHECHWYLSYKGRYQHIEGPLLHS